MLRSFLLISYRNIQQNKGASLLNILCLALAMATCIFIFNYVYYESTYERFHKNASSLYRVETHTILNYDVDEKNAHTPFQLGNDLAKAHAEIAESTTLFSYSENGTAFFTWLRPDSTEKVVYLKHAYFAQPSFTKLFTLDFLAGDAESALTQENSIILSYSNVQSIFGEIVNPKEVIGRQLQSNNLDLRSESFTITGVFKDLTENTHLPFDALASMGAAELSAQVNTCYTYLQIPSGWQEIDNHLRNSGRSMSEEFNKEEIYALRPINQIHVASQISNDPGVNNSALFLAFLGAIGFIILLLACTNFINNSIINSVDRAREIAVRKIAGMLPRQLFFTVLAESFFINVVAALLGLAIFVIGFRSLIVLGDFNYPIGLTLSTLKISGIMLLVLIIVITLLSGIYPALLQLSLSPVDALRGSAKVMASKQSSKGSKVIRFLVIFQLAMSIVFLSAMYVVEQQLDFMRAKDDEPFRLNVTLKFGGLTGVNDIYTAQSNIFLSAFEKNSDARVLEVTNLFRGQIKTEREIKALYWTEKDTIGVSAPFILKVADHSLWENQSDVFLSGVNFDKGFGKDWNQVIINESAMRIMELGDPDAALGKELGKFNGYLYVKGVISNESADESPTVYVTGYRYPTYFDLSFNTLGGEAKIINRTISTMQTRWQRYFPWAYFIDRKYEDQSASEEILLRTFSLFSIIAVSIACLGIFILSAFTTIKRTKEIGVRKVLGASVLSILLILIYDFMRLMLVSSLFAAPLVLFGTYQWLETYPKHVEISPLFVVGPILAMLLLACIIISTQSWKTTASNPIRALRSN